MNEMRAINIHQDGGAFHGKGFDDVTTNRMIWQVQKMTKAKLAPAPQARHRKGKDKAPKRHLPLVCICGLVAIF